MWLWCIYHHNEKRIIDFGENIDSPIYIFIVESTKSPILDSKFDGKLDPTIYL